MRQVNHDELVHFIGNGLREIGPALLNQMKDGRQAVKDQARYTAARMIADKLARLEILSTAPEPPLFKRGGGHAPMIEGEE